MVNNNNDHRTTFLKPPTGIYIMQNTMVRGRGKWSAGENKKYELGKNNEKGEKALKMHLFGPRPPQTYLSVEKN